MNDEMSKKITNKLADKDFRRKLMQDKPDLSVLEELGYGFDANVEVKVVTSTKHITYFTMPNDSISLKNISAAVAVGVGTAATIGTVCASLSSASTAGSAIIT